MMKKENPSTIHSEAQNKRAYTKPVLRKIQLVAEEAVLATCKLGNVSSRTNCQARGDLLCRFTATS